MKKLTLITLMILIVIASSVLFGWYYFTHHFKLLGDCKNDRLLEMKSPANDYLATEFRQNCGATSDWATIVELKNLSSGNKKRVLSLKGDLIDACKMNWGDEHLLNISCAAYSSNIYTNETSFEDIKIIVSFSQE